MLSADAIAAEQRVVDRLYALLDRETADSLAALQAWQRADHGRTPAALAERDALLDHQVRRVRQLQAATTRLCFGRLDLDGGDRYYVGRVGLGDPDTDGRALVDWRAPAAAAFYQATRAQRMGVSRRRHIVTEGRRVTAVQDDVLDLDDAPAVEGGLDSDAALLASLDAPREGRMREVVATIQAEQDAVIRAPLEGVRVVQGGPGTGKTVVALHRAAYLLYTHRDRLRSGILVVGPGRAFLDYIEQVLPSLGETGAVLVSPGELHPGVAATATDVPAVAALKGHLRMARAVATAVEAMRTVPPRDVPLDIDGENVPLRPGDVTVAMRRAERDRLPHNEGRVVFINDLLKRLQRRLEDRLGYRAQDLDEATRHDLRRSVYTSPDVRREVSRCWPIVRPETLVRTLLGDPALLARARFTPAERDALLRPADAPFTVSDVPLLDEAATLLGTDPSPRRRAAARAAADRAAETRYAAGVAQLSGEAGQAVDAATLAERYVRGETETDDGSAPTYGHVVVDEAQDLTPMQWRAILRRCPSRSLTVVGDIAQATRPGAATSWAEALAPHVGDRWTLGELTVNYRLPRPINDLAERALVDAGVAFTRTRSVREGHDALVEHTVPGDLLAAAREIGLRDHAASEGRRSVAVIAAADVVSSQGETAPLALLTPDGAKGMEFDIVVVVDPDRLRREGGPRALFVALTRATQRLHVLRRAGER